MIKILFSDLDGTLLKNEITGSGRVTKENIEAIHILEQHGVRFAIATSRSCNFLGTRMKLDKPFDTVAFNGNYVLCDDHIIDCVTFTNDEVETLVDIFGCKEDNMSMFVTKENDCVFYDYNYPSVQTYVLETVEDHDVRSFVSKTSEGMINRIIELKDMYYGAIEFKFYDCEIVPEETGNIFNDISNEAPTEMKKTNFAFTYGNCVVNFVPNNQYIVNTDGGTSNIEMSE